MKNDIALTISVHYPSSSSTSPSIRPFATINLEYGNQALLPPEELDILKKEMGNNVQHIFQFLKDKNIIDFSFERPNLGSKSTFSNIQLPYSKGEEDIEAFKNDIKKCCSQQGNQPSFIAQNEEDIKALPTERPSPIADDIDNKQEGPLYRRAILLSFKEFTEENRNTAYNTWQEHCELAKQGKNIYKTALYIHIEKASFFHQQQLECVVDATHPTAILAPTTKSGLSRLPENLRNHTLVSRSSSVSEINSEECRTAVTEAAQALITKDANHQAKFKNSDDIIKMRENIKSKKRKVLPPYITVRTKMRQQGSKDKEESSRKASKTSPRFFKPTHASTSATTVTEQHEKKRKRRKPTKQLGM